MKKVGKYIIISLLLLLGLCCVGILYLFFVPNSSLFNITYINKNTTKESDKFEISTISKIELNSRAYEISILESEDDNVSLKAHSNSFGFVLTKNSNINIATKLDNGTLTFNVSEPHGFATTGDSYIELYIPSSKIVNLSLSNLKAKTDVNSEIKIGNLTYTTTEGNFNLNQGQISGDMILNLNKGDFTISENVITNFNNVKLSLTTGRFNASKSVLGDISILSNARGIISVNECSNLRENQQDAGGQIYANKAMHINITAGDTIISIGTITNTATVDLTKSGSVTINHLTGISSFVTNSGNINLGTTYSPVTLQSESGNVNVYNALYSVTVKVNYGEALVNFSEDALSYLTDSNSRVLYATVKNGKLTAYGVEHIGEYNETNHADEGVRITGNGRVYISMDNIYGSNSITGNNGNVNVVVNKDSSYILKTSSVSGNVRVNLAQTPEYFGYRTRELRTTYVNCNSSIHSLDISTNYGDLTLVDTNLD